MNKDLLCPHRRVGFRPAHCLSRVAFVLIGLLANLLGISMASADTCNLPDSSADWQLVFSDEFNGSGLDRGKWDTEFLWGPSVVINNEQQYYVNDGQFGFDPFSVQDGTLAITAIKTPFARDQLYLTRAIYGPSTIELLWRVPEGAVSYQVLRDGELLGSATGGSFLDTGLREGIEYAYTVTALDASGRQLLTADVTINTDERPVSVPAQPFSLGLRANVYSATSGEITWDAPNRARRFEVYRDGALYRELNSPNFKSLFEAGLQADRIYQYRVAAYDSCGDLIIADEVTLDANAGSTGPRTVERLIVRLSEFSDTTAEIAWSAVLGARRYSVTDNGVQVLDGDARSLFIDDLVPGEDRRFRVIAYDADGMQLDATTRTVNTADNSFALNRQPFLSGIITSYNSFRFRYGRVEARARMPAGQGFWSAFWLLNAYYNQDQPEDPEIDIIEALGDRPTVANHAYHSFTDPDGDGFHTDLVSSEARASITDFSENFHVYGVIWEPGRIVWTIDGVETHRVEGDQVSDEQMYVIANLAVGGTFPGPADESTPFPSRYELDWIRVYQR